MKTIFNYFLFLLAAMSVIFTVSACNQTDANVQANAQKNKSYLRTVKPHANVFMEYQLPSTMETRQAIPVDITVISGRAVDDLKVNLRVGEGLLSADVLAYNFGTQTAGQKNTFQIMLQADEEGRYRVYLNAALVNGATVQSRSFIIPINIGKLSAAPKLKAMGVIMDDVDGEKIISMPATENP